MTPSGNGEEPLKSMMDSNRSHRKSVRVLLDGDGRGKKASFLWSWSYVLNACQKMHDSHLKQNGIKKPRVILDRARKLGELRLNSGHVT
jgi:hypothetical protein